MHPAHGGALALLGAAVTSFLATNVDALAILAPMVWSTKPGRQRYPVLIGCGVGNAVVLALALLTAAGLAVVPEDQLRWVGLVPIVMGIYRLLPRRGTRSGDGAAGLAERDATLGTSAFVDTGSGRIPTVLAIDGTENTESMRPVALLDAGIVATTAAAAESTEPQEDRSAAKVLLAHAGLTIALGGDNIAILAPLFRALGTGGSALIATSHLVLFPLLLALSTLVTRSNPEVPRLARPASACLSIVIGTVIVAG